MNIFLLNRDHAENAKAHCNKHIVKMPLELAQLLSTAHHINDSLTQGYKVKPPYAKTHENHPSAMYTRASAGNYNFVLTLARELCAEYSYRYGREHAVEKHLWSSLAFPPGIIDPTTKADAPPLCMPDYIRDFFIREESDEAEAWHNAVLAYRVYYVLEKAHLLQYKKRLFPSWIIPATDYVFLELLERIIERKPR